MKRLIVELKCFSLKIASMKLRICFREEHLALESHKARDLYHGDDKIGANVLLMNR